MPFITAIFLTILNIFRGNTVILFRLIIKITTKNDIKYNFVEKL